jgi:hypothetical protein
MEMPKMEMPRPGPEHRRLATLAGDWTGEETLFPSPWDAKGGRAKARWHARIDLDGFFLVTDYEQERAGKVTYRGHGVHGFDPKERAYTMCWFDSMGPSSPAAVRGTWEGDTLAYEHRHPMGWARYIYKMKEGDKHFTFRLEQSQDGKQWVPFVEGTYTRS